MFSKLTSKQCCCYGILGLDQNFAAEGKIGRQLEMGIRGQRNTYDLFDSIETTGGLLEPGSNLPASCAMVEINAAFVSLATPSADRTSP